MNDYLQGHLIPYLVFELKDKRTAFKVAISLGKTAVNRFPEAWKQTLLQEGDILRLNTIISEKNQLSMTEGTERFYGNWGVASRINSKFIFVNEIDEQINLDIKEGAIYKTTHPIIPIKIMKAQPYKVPYKSLYDEYFEMYDKRSMRHWNMYLKARKEEVQEGKRGEKILIIFQNT